MEHFDFRCTLQIEWQKVPNQTALFMSHLIWTCLLQYLEFYGNMFL